ncbi:MAG: hypothetical protein HeimC2_06410 [Candidatus Heimdallarchaeota archaeon LC_2]|nr:MAG: hypothetical protein HeimC2_38370 [Candidatus Heimdallarchaeota archaeon LC_2]OLS28584.1 MAG: hypothetical protein HeimC2_06410 [Candidatus Heimdallarchaeota archaeon LC_2]
MIIVIGINRFCAECGATDKPLYENFCDLCYWKYHTIAKPTMSRLGITVCIECYGVKLPLGWTYLNSVNDIPGEIANSAIKFLKANPEAHVDITNVGDVDWSNPKPEFDILYEISENIIEEFEPHQESVLLSIVLERGICKVCVSKKSGSASSVVQLRAKNRVLNVKEVNKYTEMALDISKDQLSENPTAYISDVIENHGGLDFYFGNQWTASNFISKLQRYIVGHKEKNFKLITEDKKGQRVYSITYLFRIPEIQPGDMIDYNNELFYVTHINNRFVSIKSMVDNSKAKVTDWKSLTVLRQTPVEVRKLVVSEDYNTNSYLLMDLTSYESEEISTKRFPAKLEIGSELTLLMWQEEYYLPL